MILYRNIDINELHISLFQSFHRRQVVTDCLRKIDGRWVVQSDPFIDDWKKEDYEKLLLQLKNTTSSGGLVYGAFYQEKLKGFLTVEGKRIGRYSQYADLTNLHVSEEFRRKGIGSALFRAAVAFAKSIQAQKLYISAHSAIESQAFYHAMGCVEAEEYCEHHVREEPFDCQMEYELY